MDKREIEAKTCAIMSAYIKKDFGVQDNFVSFVNSLNAVEAQLQIEKTFGIKISDAEAKGLTSVARIADFVLAKLG